MDKVNESILSETILEDMKENRIDHMTYLEGMEVLDSDVEKTVVEAMNAYDYDSYTAADVRRAIYKDNRTPEDFAALLSPAALPFLEEIAQMAQKETRKHFGNSIMMFTPLYIANYCENYCIYCGFNCHNKIRRAKLDAEGIEREMVEIAKSGLQEILILTGESEKMSDVKYIGEACKIARKYFKVIGLEVYPTNSENYAYWHKCGADYVTVFHRHGERSACGIVRNHVDFGVVGRGFHHLLRAVVITEDLGVHQHSAAGRGVEPPQVEHRFRLTGPEEMPPSVGPGLDPGVVVVGVRPAGNPDTA